MRKFMHEEVANKYSASFYLISSLRCSALSSILRANDCVESAYQGFKSTVFFIIITTSNCQVSYEGSPRHKLNCAISLNRLYCLDLKRCLRRLDSRFPETLHGRHKGLTAVIPELGMDLEDLLDRMQKVVSVLLVFPFC